MKWEYIRSVSNVVVLMIHILLSQLSFVYFTVRVDVGRTS